MGLGTRLFIAVLLEACVGWAQDRESVTWLNHGYVYYGYKIMRLAVVSIQQQYCVDCKAIPHPPTHPYTNPASQSKGIATILWRWVSNCSSSRNFPDQQKEQADTRNNSVRVHPYMIYGASADLWTSTHLNYIFDTSSYRLCDSVLDTCVAICSIPYNFVVCHERKSNKPTDKSS